MRSKTLAILLAGALTVPLTSEASDVGTSRRFGLGVQVGVPTALTLKLYLDPGHHALDAAIGWHYWGWGAGSLYTHVTYLWHPAVLYQHDVFDLDFYFGVGGFLGTWYGNYHGNPHWAYSSVYLGPRVPVGVNMNFNEFPIQLFAEPAIAVFLFPGIGVWPEFVIGGRYYF